MCRNAVCGPDSSWTWTNLARKISFTGPNANCKKTVCTVVPITHASRSTVAPKKRAVTDTAARLANARTSLTRPRAKEVRRSETSTRAPLIRPPVGIHDRALRRHDTRTGRRRRTMPASRAVPYARRVTDADRDRRADDRALGHRHVRARIAARPRPRRCQPRVRRLRAARRDGAGSNALPHPGARRTHLRAARSLAVGARLRSCAL